MAFVPEGQDVLFRDIQKPLRHPSVGDSGWMQFPQGYRFMALLAADTLSASGTKHLTLFFSAMYFSSFGRAKLRGRRFTTDHRCDPNPNACRSTKFAEEYIKGRSVPGTLCYATVTVRQWSE